MAPERKVTPALIWLSAFLLTAVSVCVTWIWFDGPLISFATNSDTLLPSAWAEIVLREHHAFGAFQLPRTTSLFPDFTVHSILQLASGSWRMATLLYGWLQFAALIAAAALIIRQITGASFWLGAAIFMLLVVSLFALDGFDGRSNLTHTRIVVEIVAHGGAFLLTLFAASLVCAMLTRGATLARTALLFLLSLLAYFSDQLTVFEFAVPVGLVLVWDWRNVDWRMAGARILAPIVLGMGSAHLLLLFVNTQAMGLHIRFGGWGELFSDSSGEVIVLWYLPALVLALPQSIRDRIAPDLANASARFYWRFAMLATALTVCTTVFLVYGDDGGFRYFYTLAWWPPILIAALIAAKLSRFRYAALGACTAALLIVLPQLPHHPPAILNWTTPVADCLSAHRRAEKLDAGLADYWLARRTEAALDWSLPMEQVSQDGRFYYWGNDRERARDNAARYNFILLKDLDPAKIRARYGAPRKVLHCPSTVVWLYPKGVLAGLLAQ